MIVAGGTVVISILGLAFMGVSFLYGVAISASLAVLVVVVASSRCSLRSSRSPGGASTGCASRASAARSERTAARSRPAGAALIQRRAGIAAVAGAAVLIAADRCRCSACATASQTRATTPTARIDARPRTSSSAAASAPARPGRCWSCPSSRRAGRSSPAGCAARRACPSSPRSAPARTARPPVHRDADVVAAGRRPPPSSSTGCASWRRSGVEVGGLTAAFVDQSDYVAGRIPIFIAGVVLLSFLLLLLAFRAPLIALKAGVMNLLSVGAAYGVVALAAEGGAFGSLLGVDTDTPVPPFIPVMMFAVLFGLSMDYEVFLLSRMREEYLRDGETRAGRSRDGLAKTARVITAAAAIMVVVFLAFITSTEVFLKLMGVGMATAILVDATIVRMVLVPAVMQLLGRANWWIPGWLDRFLPRVDGDGRPEPVAERA